MIEQKLYWYWGITEISTAVFLSRGITGWSQIVAFLTSHGLSLVLTYTIYVAVIGSDRQ